MRIKNTFPLLKNESNLIYFDSAATTLKPKTVIEAESYFLTHCGANPHNDAFPQAFKANEILENARTRIAKFIVASSNKEIIFNSGATEGINQIAFGLINEIKTGDEILLTTLEHASNILPWITVANQKKASIKMMDLDKNYEIDAKKLAKLLSPKTKIVAFASTSNTMGVFNDIPKITKIIRQYAPQAFIIVDAAQSVAHSPTNVKEWDGDFVVFSIHKMFGPFGLGVLWGKMEYLQKLVPLTYGGGMLRGIDESLKTYLPTSLPAHFEPGTPNIEAIAAVGAAIDFIENLGWTKIINKEHQLSKYLRFKIKENDLEKKYDFYNLDLNKSNTLFFNAKQWSSHEVANWLGYKHNIAVRGGVHCAWLTERLLDIKTSVRLSLGIYNTKKEIDQFIQALKLIDQEMPDFIFEGK